MGAIRTLQTKYKHIMDLNLTDPNDASGTKLAHLVVEQGPPVNASQREFPFSLARILLPTVLRRTRTEVLPVSLISFILLFHTRSVHFNKYIVQQSSCSSGSSAQ